MEIIFVAVVACLASLLTFFSGFGLGTILSPVLIIFFPVEVAIALTGIVHLLNNFFKISLVGKNINWSIGFKFGLPSIIGAFIGAIALLYLTHDIILFSYDLSGKTFHITSIKLIMASLMIAFALFELMPSLNTLKFKNNMLYIGGLISGFFGGLSGNQGALRSMFLLRCGLAKESFIATGILIACMVDVTRLSIYFSRMNGINIRENATVLITAIIAAFTGAYIGSKILRKITLVVVQRCVAIMILSLALCLALGLL